MNEDKPLPQGGDLSIEIDEYVASGIYANLAVVTHSETEFVMDFIFHSPQPPRAKVRSRIVTSPVHLKRFLGALQDNVRKYEARFGPIPSSGPGGRAFFN